MVFVVLSLFLGLIIGSFLNVVIARVPAGQSLLYPSSTCPQCHQPIQPYDNIPVLSWVILRGKGRCCAQPISWRYPAVELLTGLSFAGVTAWWLRSPHVVLGGGGFQPERAPWWVALVALLYLAAVGIALAVIDLDTKRLPSVIVIPSWWVAFVLLGLSVVLAGQPRHVLWVAAGGLGMWLFFRIQHAVYPRGMGYGDVRLAGFLGQYLAVFGWQAWLVGTFAGFFLGAAVGITTMILRGGGMKSTIPYGPYMILGAWIGMIWGFSWVNAYLAATGVS